MTSNQWNHTFNCTHTAPYSFFCNGSTSEVSDGQSKGSTCWESKGLSSRLIEKQMKGIKTKGFIQTHPHDSSDFERCVQIVSINGWESRLDEMRSYGTVWQRIISHWNELKTMLNENRLPELNKKLSSLDTIKGELKTFCGYGLNPGDPSPIETFNFAKNYVIGSHLVQPHLQEDEADLCPCVILDKFPIGMIKYYKSDGKSTGEKSSIYGNNYWPEKMGCQTAQIKDNKQIHGIINAMDKHVQSDTELWYTSGFDFCPHLVSSNELVDTSIMHFAQVFDLDGNKELGYCLISFESTHPLNPALNVNDEWMIGFQGCKWIVSPNPVKLNTLYMEDGLLNSCPDDEQVEDDDLEAEPTSSKQISVEIFSINLG